MFNLEKAISQWRKQMLDAGIRSPVPMEELESHLRDEIEHHLAAGMDEATAFKTAVEAFGKDASLSREFKKNRGTRVSAKWPRRLPMIILAGVFIPATFLVQMRNDLSWHWRIASVANFVAVALAMIFCRQINEWFPVISGRRTRVLISVLVPLLTLPGILLLLLNTLAHVEMNLGQINVFVLWGLTIMAAISVIPAGLMEAANKSPTLFAE